MPEEPASLAVPPAPSCRCGAAEHPDKPDRCARGHVLRGNDAALTTGVKSAAFWKEHAEARREIANAIITDAGHTEEDAPRALRIAADSIAQATLVRDSAYAYMIRAAGPLTVNGHARRAFLVWIASLEKLERHLRLVGLRRYAAPVNPLDAVREAVARANEEEP